MLHLLAGNLLVQLRIASNENTNGLLRQYFPKGTDLSVHTAEHLRFVEHEMNDRPRKRLDFLKPQELMTQLLLGV